MQSEEKRKSGKASRRVRRWLTAVTLGVGVAGLASVYPVPAAYAQDDPSEAEQLDNLIETLRSELERGEKQRLIDPWFLRDLRQAIDKYDNPWHRLVLEDNFARSGTPGSPWQVISGEFVNDWRYGLRSVVRPVEKPVDPVTRPPATTTPANPLAQIFAALLGQPASGAGEPAETDAAEPKLDLGTTFQAAAVIAPVRISNAFKMRAELTARPVDDVERPRFEIGAYQGQGARAGHRLRLVPGIGRPLVLQRVATDGAVVTIGAHDEPIDLLDGRAHVIEWTRATNGRMVVSINGEEAIDVTDLSNTGAFDGVSIVNRRGDMAVRSIRVSAAD